MRQLFLTLLTAMSLCSFELYPVCITVWVHGTYPALSLLRKSWLPTCKMVYVKPGLSLAKDLPKNYYFCKLAEQLHEADGCMCDINHFYTYGWHSSNVRPGYRIAEGKKLYDCIQKLLNKYQGHDSVTIRCIGFSHGGNVILNMLPHLPWISKNTKLEVVLLGTPVQESTRDFINSPHVSSAHSVYSDGDWIQCIDAQRFHHNCPKGASFWSQRRFKETDNVKQICLKVDGKKIGHTKYRRLMHYVPAILREANDLFLQQPAIKTVYVNYSTPSKSCKLKKSGNKKFQRRA